MKKKISLLGLITAGLFTQQLHAQIVGTAAYMPGYYVGIGIAGEGGFEGADTVAYPGPPGLHPRSNTSYLGFVANPLLNNWATFDGDFFTPGTPENGWGIELGSATGTKASNNRASPYEIIGAISGFQYLNGCYLVDWDGNYVGGGYNVHVSIRYQLKEDDLYYTTTVKIANNGASAIPELYYYRNVDPDNNVMLDGFSYSTQNTIVSQPSGSCGKALVSAEQSGALLSYLGFAAIGPDYRVCYGGFSNRDASDIWNGAGFTATTGSTASGDQAMSLAHKTENLLPGDTTELRFVVILDASQADNAISSLFYFNYEGGLGAARPLCSTYIDTVLSCPGKTVEIGIAGENVSDFTWTWSPGTDLNTTTGTTVVASPDEDILYTATGTPTNPCFTATIMSEIFIMMDTLQDVDFSLGVVHPNCGLPNGSLEVVNVTGGIGPIESIQWTGGPATNFYGALPEGTYEVTLIDSFGCRMDSTIFLSADVVEYAIVIPPNVFTPNGDNHNDKFVVKGTLATNYQIKIFNRWGQEVYSSNDINKSWDGKVNGGGAAAEGVYMYTIEYDNPCEMPEKQTRHGSIHLQR